MKAFFDPLYKTSPGPHISPLLSSVFQHLSTFNSAALLAAFPECPRSCESALAWLPFWECYLLWSGSLQPLVVHKNLTLSAAEGLFV